MDPGKIPAELQYTKTHEWVRLDGLKATVGITDHAQSELTDIVFVDLPSVSKSFEAGASVMVLESVKTVSDIYGPSAGRVTEVNSELKSHPELVNQDPYGKGWLFRCEFSSPPTGLLTPEEYRHELGA